MRLSLGRLLPRTRLQEIGGDDMPATCTVKRWQSNVYANDTCLCKHTVWDDINTTTVIVTRNSSEDEIANVNFLYDDIVHALQNRPTRLLYKFRHRSTRLCVGTQVYQWNNAMQRPLRVQGHRFWYQSKAHIRLPASD